MKKKLPKDFKFLFWGYDFSSLDPVRNKKLIIVNTLNYGNLKQWKWLIKKYGKENLRETIRLIPQSEFRTHIVKLIKLLFGIKKFKYVSRSAKIKAEKGI
ncbi:MAG: hypothetical protein QMC93_01050 [Patescibacteria group bacterium]|nr:hypothetical protein [Patescibacteria group bacterium]